MSRELRIVRELGCTDFDVNIEVRVFPNRKFIMQHVIEMCPTLPEVLKRVGIGMVRILDVRGVVLDLNMRTEAEFGVKDVDELYDEHSWDVGHLMPSPHMKLRYVGRVCLSVVEDEYGIRYLLIGEPQCQS